jgi:type II secretory pathway component PulK
VKLRIHNFSGRRGSALVIILVLLSVMAALILANTTTLRRLRVELQLLEQKQKRAFEKPAVAVPQPP